MLTKKQIKKPSSRLNKLRTHSQLKYSNSFCKKHKSHKTNKNMEKPNANWYKYPFSEINNNYYDYGINLIFTKLIGQNETFKDAENFPNNIKTYIWGQKGENDAEDWILLCKLTNGKYAYFIAWCDYTGFDCSGGMKLYISSKLDMLVNMAMDDKYRSKYLTFIENKKN